MHKMTVFEFENECPNCESNQVEVSTFSDDIEYKGFILDVENLQELLCKSCNHTWTNKAQYEHNQEILKKAYAVKRDFKRKEEGLLTAAKIVEIREHFGFNQREAAAIFGGGYNAFNKYESGEVLQSTPMDRLLRLSYHIGQDAINFLQSSREIVTIVKIKIESSRPIPTLVRVANNAASISSVDHIIQFPERKRA